jgi:hypothetical protein
MNDVRIRLGNRPTKSYDGTARAILPDAKYCALNDKEGTQMKKTALTRRAFLAKTSVGLAAPTLAAGAGAVALAGGGRASSAKLQAAAFVSDITPPLGSPLPECKPPFAASADIPLLAKGVVISDGNTRYVLCALDYCELRLGAYDLFRRAIANALGVNELQIEVHCLHPHDTPLYDTNAELLVEMLPSPPHTTDLPFIAIASERVASAARAALSKLQPLTHVACGKAKVEKFASNRRVPLPDGKIGVRLSHCNDPVLIAAPEGLIDPWMRTITLFNRQRPIARLHYYASHPQSYYGQGHMNPDTTGIARELLEKDEGIPQIYFNGCAGNVAAGKYNDGSHPMRMVLANRLCDGMKAAIAATGKPEPATLAWKTADVLFPPRQEPDYSEQYFRTVLADVTQTYPPRMKAALALAWYERLKFRPTVDITSYRLGPAVILHLPGEAFVEYQLFAQSVRPNDFVAVASYGEGGTGYICTDKAFAEGGYEPTASFVSPPTEALLKAAISEVLKNSS